MLSIICAPATAPQTYIPPPQPPPPRFDDVDRRIVEAIREVQQAKIWSVLNMVSGGAGLSRSAGRTARLNHWQRIKRLKRLGLIHGVGRNEIAAAPPAARSRPRPSPAHQPTVNSGIFAEAVTPDGCRTARCAGL